MPKGTSEAPLGLRSLLEPCSDFRGAKRSECATQQVETTPRFPPPTITVRLVVARLDHSADREPAAITAQVRAAMVNLARGEGLPAGLLPHANSAASAA